jgi:ABC-type sugar transport system substrate-binding protein
MKKTVLVLFVLVLLVANGMNLFAGGAKESGDEKLNIVFVTPLVAHPVWDVARDGFEDGLAAFGAEGQYVGPQGIDPAEMVNQIEIAMINGADGIITMPIAPTAMRPIFKKAAEKGVPIVFVGAEDPESTSLAFIGTNEANMGAMGAEGIKAKFAAEGNPPLRAMVLMSTFDASFAIKSRDGYIEAMKDYPDFEVVLVEACNSDMVIAMDKFSSAFQAYPEINLVIGVCGEAGPAAAKVVKEMGRDDITIIAVDDVAETMDLVKDGTIYGTMAQNFYKMGHLGVELLVDFITEGKKPAAVSNDSGSIFVTKGNMSTYSEMLKQ